MIRILIVGDEQFIQKGLHLRLAAESDMEVIGGAVESESALALTKRLCPDVVIIDIDMPKLDGLALAEAINADCPLSSVILISVHDDAATRLQALESGAQALVVKSLPANTLLAAIRQAVG